MNLNLDKKDVAILRELDQHVRASFSQIGKKTRLNKETVQYRIKKLEENKVITGYWTLLDFGYGFVYKILIKNRNLSGQKKEEFEKFVASQKRVSWLANTQGNFDYIITVFAKTNEEFINFVDELLLKYGSFFQEKHILKSSVANVTNDKYLYPENKFIYNYKINFIKINQIQDEIESKILTALSLNARAKFSEIAKSAGITPEAVSYRFKDIQKRKLIAGFKVRINFEKIGLAYYHMFISFRNQKIKQDLIAFYTAHPDCNTTMSHIGYYDLHIELILHENKIQTFMDEFLERFSDNLSSYELLRINKEHVLRILK